MRRQDGFEDQHALSASDATTALTACPAASVATSLRRYAAQAADLPSLRRHDVRSASCVLLIGCRPDKGRKRGGRLTDDDLATPLHGNAARERPGSTSITQGRTPSSRSGTERMPLRPRAAVRAAETPVRLECASRVAGRHDPSVRKPQEPSGRTWCYTSHCKIGCSHHGVSAMSGGLRTLCACPALDILRSRRKPKHRSC